MAVDADDAGGRTPRRPSLQRPGLRDHANIAAAALFVAALAIAGTIAWRQHHRSPPPAPVVTVGAIDTPVPEAIVGTTVHIAGWALDPEGVRGVVIRVDGKYRMWYLAGADDAAVNKVDTSFRPAYAESDDGIHWVKPELVAEIKFTEWTHETDGGGIKMRAPVFQGLRWDKSPRECVFERPKPVLEEVKKAGH